MRRILLLTYAFPPDNIASATRPGQLYRYLPEFGYQPLVLASSSNGSMLGSGSIQRVPAGRPKLSTSLLSHLAHWFTRFCAPYDDRLNWSPHAAAAAARIIKSGQIDVMYSTSPPFTAHFAALWLKTRYGVPWIADFQDPLRDNPMRLRKWIFPYDKIIERAFFKHADLVLANTDTVLKSWHARYPEFASKTAVLWNSYDPHESIERAPPPARPYRLLAHVGGLYGGRHPQQLLLALERLGIKPSDLRVKLVGPIANETLTRYGELLDRLRTSGVLEFENRLVPRETAMRETHAADYLLLLDVNDVNASLQVPSKLLDYIRFGKPILAFSPPGSPVDRILERSDIPYVVVDPSASDLETDRKVREFLRLPVGVAAPSSWFEKTFDARNQASMLADLSNKLLQQRERASADSARRTSPRGQL